jgi:hypothetical protein
LLNFGFGALSPNLFLAVRQVSEIMFYESSKNTENALIEWLGKDNTRYFTKIKVYVVYLFMSLVFKTVFEILLAPLVGLKSVKIKCLETFKSVIKEYSDSKL